MDLGDVVPVHPLQWMLDGMSAEWQLQWQKDRATQQMTLGALIAELSSTDGSRMIAGFGAPMSYRGYYCDLSFDPDGAARTAAEMLAVAAGCMGQVFQGYKGGNYVMGAGTPLWIAAYGDCGRKLVGVDWSADPATPVTGPDDD